MKSRAHILVTTACAVLAATGIFLAWRAHTAARDIENRQAKLAAQTASLKERLHALDAEASEKTNDAKTSPSERETAREHSVAVTGDSLHRHKFAGMQRNCAKILSK